MQKRKFYLCEACKNLMGVVNDSGVTPVCCGSPMKELVPNSTDAAGEKHVPALVRSGKSLQVQVGSVPHPMLEEHFIQWIMVQQGDKVQRVALKPGQEPKAAFVLDSEDPVSVYEYCNLHGLWVAEG